MSHDEHTGEAAPRPSTRSTRPGRLPRILAIAVLAGGSLLMGTGAAQAAAPAGPIKCANGQPYVVTAGGVDGCEAPLTEPEKKCVDGAKKGGTTGAIGGAGAGAMEGGAGAVPGGIAGGAFGAAGGCVVGQY